MSEPDLSRCVAALEAAEDELQRRLQELSREAGDVRPVTAQDEDWLAMLRESGRLLAAHLREPAQARRIPFDEPLDAPLLAPFAERVGEPLDRLLGVTKLVRQAFSTLLQRLNEPRDVERRVLEICHRFFDELELAACRAWTKPTRTSSRLGFEGSGYQTIFESMTEPAFLVDDELRILEANAALEAFLGIPKEELTGRACRSVFESDLCETCPALEAMAAGVPSDQRFNRATACGDVRQYVMQASPLESVGPERSGAAVVLLDVTERQRAQRALQEETERLRVTLQSIGEGVITTDTEGRVLLLNDVAARLTGHSPEDAIGRPVEELLELFNPATELPCPSLVREVLAEGRPTQPERSCAIRTASGGRRLVAVHAAPLRGAEGEVLGAVVALRDVTEARETERQRIRSQRLESIARLARGVAHDFNNLLTGVAMYLELAKLAGGGEPEVDGALDGALESCMSAKHLTHQLLTFAAGGEPVRTATDLPQLLRNSCRLALSGSRTAYELDLEEPIWPVEVDALQMGQVFQNLLSNAAEAMGEGGRLRVLAENQRVEADSSLPLAPGDYVRVRFRDQGPGVPVEHQGRIFEPYFTTKPQASGLGLATATAITSRHQGYISVDSRPGEGATFNVYVPAAGEATATRPSSRSIQEPSVGPPHRILLMDDEEMVRASTGAALRRLGCEATLACDGAEVISLVSHAAHSGWSFDALLLDLTVRGGLGAEETLRRVRDLDAEVPAIVMSGYAAEEVVARPADFGFAAALVKPFDVPALAAALKAVLE